MVQKQQLKMAIAAEKIDRLPTIDVPPGYELRAYRAGDEDAWLTVLHRSGFEGWDRPRLDDYLSDDERREGSRIAAYRRHAVAVTFASRNDHAGVLDFVATDPNHQGKGLGRAVCTSVLKFFRERGYDAVELRTDDERFPAIHLYLSMGFEPVMCADDMAGRWQAVKVALTRQEASCSD